MTTTTLAPVLIAWTRAAASVARIVLMAPTPSARRIIVPAKGIAKRTPMAIRPTTTMFSTSPKPLQDWNLAITPGPSLVLPCFPLAGRFWITLIGSGRVGSLFPPHSFWIRVQISRRRKPYLLVRRSNKGQVRDCPRPCTSGQVRDHGAPGRPALTTPAGLRIGIEARPLQYPAAI